ncbi:hypothetical protein BX666DRAFT_2006214 [Dichotomocladium elegans]|nr:hypothetical protein BX666DRAFT_2006214 [Dichotomocladium elegans]
MRFTTRLFHQPSSRRSSVHELEPQPRRSSLSRIFEGAANTIRRRSSDVFALDSSSISSFSSSFQHHADFTQSSCLLSPTSREFEALIVEHPTRTVRFSVTPNYAA